MDQQHNVGIVARALRLLITGLLRVAFKLYFRSINVQGLERFPQQGPVLLVANHPNSLLDPAILTTLLPRPIHYGAAIVIFKGPFVRYPRGVWCRSAGSRPGRSAQRNAVRAFYQTAQRNAVKAFCQTRDGWKHRRLQEVREAAA